MNAVVLIGHGSLRSDSGASMIRLTARLRQQGIAPIAEAGFLNFSRPTLAEAVAKCVAQGATTVTVQPYFLIDGVYVQKDLPGDVSAVEQQFPGVKIKVSGCLGFHEKMVEIVLDRIQAVDPLPARPATALLVMAHGTPLAAANEPIRQIAGQLQEKGGYSFAVTAYLDCNTPSIGDAIDLLVAQGARKIVALPYFLHRGRHLREDIPAILCAARQRHPDLPLLEAPHLDYDLRLVDIIAERLGQRRTSTGEPHTIHPL